MYDMLTSAPQEFDLETTTTLWYGLIPAITPDIASHEDMLTSLFRSKDTRVGNRLCSEILAGKLVTSRMVGGVWPAAPQCLLVVRRRVTWGFQAVLLYTLVADISYHLLKPNFDDRHTNFSHRQGTDDTHPKRPTVSTSQAQLPFLNHQTQLTSFPTPAKTTVAHPPPQAAS